MVSSRQLTQKSFLRRLDWPLIALIIILCIISVTTIHSAMGGGQYSLDFGVRQIFYYILGAIIAFMIMLFSPKKIRNYTYTVYIIFNILLFGLILLPESSITPVINGAKSWYRFGPISIQPSEFMKIVLILVISKVVAQHNRFTFNKSFQTDVMLLLKIAGVSFVPIALILLQNDLGTTLVFLAIIAGIVIVSGVTWKILAPLFGSAIVLGGSLILSIIYKPSLIENVAGIKTYQLGRINSWLDPYAYSSGDGFHLTESLKAIGSGQLIGKGLNNGEVYIPENHTDFIFSVIGEEFGFLGSVILLGVFLLLLLHLIRMAMNSDDLFNKSFIIGFISLLLFHIFQNIGMTIQLLPITGIPLPFISYGGSSLWSLMSGVGVLLSIHYHTPKKYNDEAPTQKRTTS
ncbi:FtsW/RodA/SpoVE family cell cycle protein [Staphylococcus pseudintermedius]|uniref:FtsW/RodA/SpoVE family cell cycle protein n=1 Tax=Staphylococcus pseudintermedius TaxID=283734 RepID=UPI000D731EFC|nr:FtsW/RodA/SpoVE family cell cycle protein [Staphylococcus pseudintermedius]MBU7228663.1 rod shape-determining protein RodA [Staphylococcus pseudintermedius]MCE5589996.1 rod shape-determining protein RodA [Staphylococcus pseudintermedius]MDU0287018.1 FtsW/RodA/SpoVE family cell cycle protein [Staphylococcus pseudintermedius]MDU0383171.1 FtsW/RodA/SpoVE family cell cycle protein [Staphylococcus pseudintermedius]PWZ35379.1 rod shape-determining protein RodA [Staphylococcus pseudintermedius]